jgi:hypothetical protein
VFSYKVSAAARQVTAVLDRLRLSDDCRGLGPIDQPGRHVESKVLEESL